MENIRSEAEDFNLQITDTLDSINEIVNEVAIYGFDTIDEREIVYGITTAVGIDPAIDTVMEVGCNVAEFYFYIERLLGTPPVGYYGIEPDEKLIDISRFRVADGNTEFYNIEMQSIIDHLKDNDITEIKQIMDINVDWGVLINQFNQQSPIDIISTIELFIQIPNKGLVITNKFDKETINNLVETLNASDKLYNRYILRSDFLPGWYSIYFYNNR